jgi:prepilin-type processing-associated H-X9-DG protein
MSCTNNLKQFGLALHNYANTNRDSFPSTRQTVGSDAKFRAWTPIVLAYVEQDNVGRQWNFSQKWNSATPAAPQVNNLSQSQTKFKVFNCPSAPDGRVNGAYNPPLGTGDYIVFHQIRRRFYQANNITPLPATDLPGAMQNGKDVSIMSITDGTSNTVLITENAGRPSYFMLGRAMGTVVPSNEGFGWADPDGCSGSVDGSHPTTGAINTGSAFTGGTCVMNCNNDSEPYSFHSGGINVCMADGSVRFLRATVAPATFAAMITCNNGEVISAND